MIRTYTTATHSLIILVFSNRETFSHQTPYLDLSQNIVNIPNPVLSYQYTHHPKRVNPPSVVIAMTNCNNSISIPEQLTVNYSPFTIHHSLLTIPNNDNPLVFFRFTLIVDIDKETISEMACPLATKATSPLWLPTMSTTMTMIHGS